MLRELQLPFYYNPNSSLLFIYSLQNGTDFVRFSFLFSSRREDEPQKICLNCDIVFSACNRLRGDSGQRCATVSHIIMNYFPIQ